VIIPDFEIRRLCEHDRMIVPFDPEQLNPASYDVLLGNHLMVETVSSPELVLVDISDCSKEHPYWLPAGGFALAETFETFNIPDDIAAQFILKSSRGREGLSHALCGYCDPGWNGSKLTLELHSLRQLHPLPLYPGLKIGQLVFSLMSGRPDRTYAVTGRYNGDNGVTASKG
jgi:dCTP deaminase